MNRKQKENIAKNIYGRIHGNRNFHSLDNIWALGGILIRVCTEVSYFKNESSRTEGPQEIEQDNHYKINMFELCANRHMEKKIKIT